MLTKNKLQPDEKTKLGLLEIYGDDQRISRIFYGFSIAIFIGFLIELIILHIINDRFQEMAVLVILPFLLIRLKRAVENTEWLVYYQPIISLPDRKVVGAEALVRWDHPQRGLINPTQFIHIAEDTGLIFAIGEFVLRKSCMQVVDWRRNNPGLCIAVNISARQFQDQNLLPTIEKILEETGCPGEALHLEITESVAMKDFAYSSKILNQLTGLGIQITLDDFGIGYSSFSYLSRFPIKILKIDSWFIAEIFEKENNEAIISAIISMSHALNLQVIAEGVETEKQILFLQAKGCDHIQGYLFSSAVPPEMFEKRLLLKSI